MLKEYRERHKTNQLVDKRFGEYDENLTAEEKMMKRFMMEKQVCVLMSVINGSKICACLSLEEA